MFSAEEYKREMQLEADSIQEAEAKRQAKVDAMNKRREEAIAQRRMELEAAQTESMGVDDPSGEERDSPQSKRSRRAVTQNIDYAALAKKLEEEKTG